MKKEKMNGNRKKLMDLANLAREKAYCPYSCFSVGAALLCSDGSIVTGCNVENAAFLSLCAERNAISKAVSEGKRQFKAIAVVGGKQGETAEYCPPCGACRQVMVEFCDPDLFEIILYDSEDTCKTFSLSELLPESFKGL